MTTLPFATACAPSSHTFTIVRSAPGSPHDGAGLPPLQPWVLRCRMPMSPGGALTTMTWGAICCGASGHAQAASGEVLVKEGQHSLPGVLGRFLMIRAPGVAMEAVVGLGVAHDVDIGPRLRCRFAQSLDLVDWD